MTATATMTVRVTVFETWQTMSLATTPDESVAALKLRALAACRIAPEEAAAWEVKVGGARVREETASLAAAGVTDGGALVLMRQRRRAVR